MLPIESRCCRGPRNGTRQPDRRPVPPNPERNRPGTTISGRHPESWRPYHRFPLPVRSGREHRRVFTWTSGDYDRRTSGQRSAVGRSTFTWRPPERFLLARLQDDDVYAVTFERYRTNGAEATSCHESLVHLTLCLVAQDACITLGHIPTVHKRTDVPGARPSSQIGSNRWLFSPCGFPSARRYRAGNPPQGSTLASFSASRRRRAFSCAPSTAGESSVGFSIQSPMNRCRSSVSSVLPHPSLW